MSSTTITAEHPVHEELGGYEGAKLGMWLFLATELLLFGVLFAAFGLFHTKFSAAFQLSHHSLDKVMGAVNTVVLIVSSMSAALALDSVQRGRRRLTNFLLLCTIILAGLFLVVKYFEYTQKFDLNILPGSAEHIKDPEINEYVNVEEYIAGQELAGLPTEHLQDGINLFFTFYFVMTGVHGLHVVIGMTILFILLLKNRRGRYSHWYYTPIENGALYWHLVDLIWIYLFPLFYLIS